MNYAGFLRPVWTWLRGDELPDELRVVLGLPVGCRAGGERGRRDDARVPRRRPVAVRAPLVDAARQPRHARASARSPARASVTLVGIGLQMTTPGVPMIFAGDELGLEGEWGEDGADDALGPARELGPPLLEDVPPLIALRRSSDALARGGIRYAHVGDDAIAYLRETRASGCSASPPRRARAGPAAARRARRRGSSRWYGGDARVADGEATLPGDGPAFHVWRLHEHDEGGWLRSCSTRSTRSTTTASRPSRTSRSRSTTASSSSSSARPAAARRPRCAWSPGSRTSPTARSRSAAASSTT